jgi:hypothetical protein
MFLTAAVTATLPVSTAGMGCESEVGAELLVWLSLLIMLIMLSAIVVVVVVVVVVELPLNCFPKKSFQFFIKCKKNKEINTSLKKLFSSHAL